MTDVSPDPDWWQASDGKWYPPHLHPDVLNAGNAGSDAPREDDTPAATVFEPTGESPAVQPPSLPPYTATELPEREPIDWEQVAAERNARRHADESRRRKRIVGAALVGLGALALLVGVAQNRGGGDDDRAEQPPSSTTAAPSSTVDPTTTSGAPTSTASTVPGITTVSVFELQPGMCVNNAELSSGLVTDLSAIPCDQPHTHEVYFKVTFSPPDGAYDAQRVATFADEQCSQAFANYVGVTYDKSKYYFLHLAPSAESWKEQGDRDVVCLLFQQGTTLAGSAQGTAQ